MLTAAQANHGHAVVEGPACHAGSAASCSAAAPVTAISVAAARWPTPQSSAAGLSGALANTSVVDVAAQVVNSAAEIILAHEENICEDPAAADKHAPPADEVVTLHEKSVSTVGTEDSRMASAPFPSRAADAISSPPGSTGVEASYPPVSNEHGAAVGEVMCETTTSGMPAVVENENEEVVDVDERAITGGTAGACSSAADAAHGVGGGGSGGGAGGGGGGWNTSVSLHDALSPRSAATWTALGFGLLDDPRDDAPVAEPMAPEAVAAAAAAAVAHATVAVARASGVVRRRA